MKLFVIWAGITLALLAGLILFTPREPICAFIQNPPFFALECR